MGSVSVWAGRARAPSKGEQGTGSPLLWRCGLARLPSEAKTALAYRPAALVYEWREQAPSSPATKGCGCPLCSSPAAAALSAATSSATSSATDPDVTVVNFDALTYAGNLANLADLADHPRYRFVQGRHHRPRAAVRTPVGRASTHVIHFAAESHVDRSIQDSGPFVRTNVLGTQVLLDAAREFAVEALRPGVHRRGLRQPRPDRLVHRETPLAPNSPYSASKAAADLLVRSYVHTFGLPAVITRCSNNYGPYQFPEKLIPLFITNLLRDEPVPVYGDGLQGARLDPRPRPLRGQSTASGGTAGSARSTTSAAAARRPTWS